MKKHFFIGLLFLISPLFLFAQVDVLLPPTGPEKNEVKRILNEYEKYMNATGDSLLPKEKKALATLKFSKEVVNNEVQVYRDIDTVSKEATFAKMFSYAQEFPKVFPQTVTTTLSGIVYGKVKFDKIRKYHFIEVLADKEMEWKKVQVKAVRDSAAQKDSMVYDTLRYNITRKLIFLVRFDKAGALSKNFKLLAITKAGVPPKLEPLPPLVTWWLEMDPEWKTYFREKLKLQEYPTAYEVERVSGFQELDISNKQFKNLEPLRKMHFLRKLNCSNSPISSLEPLTGLQSLNILDISRTKIKNLNGIEKLTNLTELKCTGLFLESIEPLKGLINLVKLDVSENELEDISAVKDLINLKELDFSLNIKIKSIDVVKNLINLEKLSFAKIDAKNLDAVKPLVNLIHLNAFNTNISSLEPIRNHQKLIFLALDHNKITTLDAIKDLRFLTHLTISSTNVTDISGLKNYQYLWVLDISSNPQITDLGPIHKLEYLKEFKCHYTKVSKEEVARFKKNHPDCKLTYYY